MNESMDAYMDEIEKSMKQYRKGDLIKGEIVSINDKEVMVSLGTSRDGVIPLEELDEGLESPFDKYKEGDMIEALVVSEDDGEGNLLLSKRRGDNEKVWDEFEASMAGQKTFHVKIKDVIKGGLTCEVKGVRGFIPASQVSLSYIEDLTPYKGETLEVKVIEYDFSKNNVVLSAKAILEAQREKRSHTLFEEITEGQIYTGIVSRLTDFGAFVDIGGADGLIHISELSWKRIKHPSEVVSQGDQVEVTVLNVDKPSKRIGLRLNDVQDNPWSNISEYYQENDVVNGLVSRITNFGAFIEIESGLDGLLHISEISAERVNRVSDVLSIGQAVEVMILNIDEESHKISLSMKALEEGSEDVDVSEYLNESSEDTTLGNLFKDKLKDLKLK
jgi:small subunit ribosomal protein S1